MDITTYLGPDAYSGVIFFGSTPFRSWNAEIMNPWLAGMLPRLLSDELSDLCSTARDIIDGFTFAPDKVHPATKLAWIGAYTYQHPVAKKNYIVRTQDEGALKGAVEKIPVLALLGKEDKFILPDRVEKLFKETFAEVEVQTWPEVGHLPFFEEPEKTRNAVLTFVKRITKVRLSHLHTFLRLIGLSYRLEDSFRLCKTLNAIPIITSQCISLASPSASFDEVENHRGDGSDEGSAYAFATASPDEHGWCYHSFPTASFAVRCIGTIYLAGKMGLFLGVGVLSGPSSIMDENHHPSKHEAKLSASDYTRHLPCIAHQYVKNKARQSVVLQEVGQRHEI